MCAYPVIWYKAIELSSFYQRSLRTIVYNSKSSVELSITDVHRPISISKKCNCKIFMLSETKEKKWKAREPSRANRRLAIASCFFGPALSLSSYVLFSTPASVGLYLSSFSCRVSRRLSIFTTPRRPNFLPDRWDYIKRHITTSSRWKKKNNENFRLVLL